MLLVVLALLVVAAVLAVAYGRLRARCAELEALLDDVAVEREELFDQIDDAAAQVTATGKERDDALERVQRCRRDAAEVANRLTAETAARVRAEASGLAAATEAEMLWALALARAERTWRTSIALHAEETSPISGDDPLRAAVAIEIEAAREEAGADIELRWSGDDPVPPAPALLVLGLVEEVVASVSKTAARTIVDVSVIDGAVDVSVDAVDTSGVAVAVEVPGTAAVEPGRFRVGTR